MRAKNQIVTNFVSTISKSNYLWEVKITKFPPVQNSWCFASVQIPPKLRILWQTFQIYHLDAFSYLYFGRYLSVYIKVWINDPKILPNYSSVIVWQMSVTKIGDTNGIRRWFLKVSFHCNILKWLPSYILFSKLFCFSLS